MVLVIAETVCIFVPTSRTVQSGDADIYGYVPPTVTFPDTKNPATTARRTYRNLQTCLPSNRRRRIRRQPVWLGNDET